MPFNGERNLEGCVIQHVGQHKLKPSVTLFQNFHRTASWNQLTHNERRSRMKLFALCRFAQDSGGSVRGRFILSYPREKKKIPQGSCPRHGSDTRSGSPGDTKQPNTNQNEIHLSTYAKTPVCSSAGVCPACGETCWISGGSSAEFTLGNPFL